MNEGVDKARFTGLSVAFNDNPDGYVMFVDSDDWLDKNAIERMAHNAMETNADVVSMQFKRYFFKGMCLRQKGYVDYKLYNKSDLDKLFISFFGYAGLPTYMWGKLYRIEVLKKANLQPTSYKMCEDHMFNMYLFPYIKSWSNIEYCGYVYRWGGMTCRFNPLWPELKNQNVDKRIFADKYKYLDKVKVYLDIELKNIFYSDVAQRLNYCSKSEFDDWVTTAVNDDVWMLTLDSSQIESNNDYI